MQYRQIGWIIGVVVALGTVASAVEARADCGAHGPFAAIACGSPDYGETGPGCCENSSCRCDEIWAGYCQERGCCDCCCWPAMCWGAEPRYAVPADPPGTACVASTTPKTPANAKTVVARRPTGRLAMLPSAQSAPQTPSTPANAKPGSTLPWF